MPQVEFPDFRVLFPIHTSLSMGCWRINYEQVTDATVTDRSHEYVLITPFGIFHCRLIPFDIFLITRKIQIDSAIFVSDCSEMIKLSLLDRLFCFFASCISLIELQLCKSCVFFPAINNWLKLLINLNHNQKKKPSGYQLVIFCSHF